MADSDKAKQRRLEKIQGRFRAVHKRFDTAGEFRTTVRSARTWIAAGICFAVTLTILLSPWPLATTLRHIAAAPNCGMARLVGLAPAHRGEPGYYPWHDADGDGTACESYKR